MIVFLGAMCGFCAVLAILTYLDLHYATTRTVSSVMCVVAAVQTNRII